MKPFDIELAKAGHSVCTRDGRKARIICFDVKGNFPIAVAVTELEENTEIIYTYPLNGRARLKGNQNHSLDLMMASEKKTGWINIYPFECEEKVAITGSCAYKTQKDAKENASGDCIATIPIEWEE